MKAIISGALLLSLFYLCEAGTEVHLELNDNHFELSIDQHENPEPEKPEPMMTTTPAPHDAEGYGPYPIKLTVMNSLQHSPNKTYSTEVAYRGILIGAMRRIEKAYNDFSFTTTDHPDYGPSLQSVNGVVRNATAHTYWQLLGTTASGKIAPPDVGIGCYIPKPNEQVYLKFTKW